MKRSKFTEEQIIGILREQGRRTASAERRRRRSAVATGSAAPRVSAWKAKFGGMDVSDAKRLKALEDENARLKRLLAESLLD